MINDRFSKDSSRANKHGVNLFEFCNAVNLLMINELEVTGVQGS